MYMIICMATIQLEAQIYYLSIYRIGGNFRGMKFSRLSRMVPASRTYNREHFMHQQCKLLNMIPPGEDL